MITSDQIQSIVDGECSHETRALLLKGLENQPSGWRTLALLLLEEQQWSKGIAAIPQCKGSSQLEPLIGSHANSTANTDSRVQLLVRLSKPASNGTRFQTRNAPWLSALAASLLLGIGIYGGSTLSKWESSRNTATEPKFVGIANEKSAVGDVISRIPTMRESDMTILVSGPNNVKSEIPVYDLDISDQDLFFAKENYEIAKINQRLRREGYELDVRPEYYTGKLNDGRNLIVPVKHVGVRPYGL